MNAASPVTAVFVYGTLQRGQCRESCWPHPPLKIEEATIQGRLYDLGQYPALVDGEDWVGGELWHFASVHMSDTVEALDDVEGVADSLYVRRLVQCQTTSGPMREAYTYIYARPVTTRHRPVVAPGSDGICRWPQRGPVT